MKNYKSISFEGTRVPVTSISHLRTLIRRGKRKEGTYACVAPNGNVHHITFMIKAYSAVGYGRKPSGKSKTKKRSNWGTYNVLQTKITVSAA